jgi:MFS transporter, PAT family, beta-lactamase induction signal transducer AmpG
VNLKSKLFIVSLLYFAEGFPYGIIERTLPIYFRLHEMSLTNVGLLAMLGLPYALKFVWAPAVDFLGTRRYWIAAAQLLMAFCLLMLIPLDPKNPSILLWASIICLAVFSATQDIAIDAYTIELLKTSEMGIANGFRQAAYRVAMIISGGAFITLGGWLGWKITYFFAAAVLFVCAIIALWLPHVEIERPKLSFVSLVAPLKDFVSRPGFIQVACFILLYKLGDMAMGPMVHPFWLYKGLGTEEIGLITSTLGIGASIAGGLAGGIFMVRFGIFHGLWFLGLFQAVSNLGYTWVAMCPECGNWSVYAASGVESFCAGLGTSAFLAFLMSICKKEFSATQYAVLSALFKITGVIAGSFSGAATSTMGYASYFTLTFFLCIPAFAFIFHAKAWIPPNGTGD